MILIDLTQKIIDEVYGSATQQAYVKAFTHA